MKFKKLIILPILLMAIVLTGAGCVQNGEGSSPSRAYLTLEENGYTEIELTGMPLFTCDSKSDSLLNSSGFEAKNHLGKQVSGSVCCGWLKGCTIRF